MPLLLAIFQATTSSSRRGMEDIGRGAAGADFGGKGRETFGGFFCFFRSSLMGLCNEAKIMTFERFVTYLTYCSSNVLKGLLKMVLCKQFVGGEFVPPRAWYAWTSHAGKNFRNVRFIP